MSKQGMPAGGVGSIIRHGFYQTSSRKRRRYLCRSCGKTFCSNAGTPYYRLQHQRATFDEVATLSVEGLNKSAIARVKQIAWNTVARWLEKAAHSCRRFNDRRIATLAVAELQADEIRTTIDDGSTNEHRRARGELRGAGSRPSVQGGGGGFLRILFTHVPSLLGFFLQLKHQLFDFYSILSLRAVYELTEHFQRFAEAFQLEIHVPRLR
jgi:transposase-like protein